VADRAGPAGSAPMTATLPGWSSTLHAERLGAVLRGLHDRRLRSVGSMSKVSAMTPSS
jgi:hypothetical protein